MISWISSSSRRAGTLVAAALLAAAASTADGADPQPEPGAPAPVEAEQFPAGDAPASAEAAPAAEGDRAPEDRPQPSVPPPKPSGPAISRIRRVAIFPPDNFAAGSGRDPTLTAAAAEVASRAGFEVVPGDVVDRFLTAERIRYTSGLDRRVARAARESLGVDGVLFTTFESGGPGALRIALTMRLVATGDLPEIAWIDGFARTGDDAPGLLRLGVVGDPQKLRKQALDALATSLAAARAGEGRPSGRCRPGHTYAPKFSFHLPPLADDADKVVILLPFLDSSRRWNAGEIVRLAVTRALLAAPGIHVVDPGDVRLALLEYRIILRGGVSVATASTMLKTLRADWVVAGEVRRFEEGRASVEFNLHVLDRTTEEIIWQSRSYNDGNDGVRFFRLGEVSTSSELACRMAAEIVAEALPGRFAARRERSASR